MTFVNPNNHTKIMVVSDRSHGWLVDRICITLWISSCILSDTNNVRLHLEVWDVGKLSFEVSSMTALTSVGDSCSLAS